jgi:hypothetical protein
VTPGWHDVEHGAAESQMNSPAFRLAILSRRHAREKNSCSKLSSKSPVGVATILSASEMRSHFSPPGEQHTNSKLHQNHGAIAEELRLSIAV